MPRRCGASEIDAHGKYTIKGAPRKRRKARGRRRERAKTKRSKD